MEPCKSQYVNPKNATLLQTCAARTGFDYSALEQCATGPAGVAALQKSADFYHGFRDSEGKSVAYGMQGLPVVLVNNKLVSKFWECSVKLETVIAAICEAFTGERPSVCAQEPPVDDEIAPVGGRVGRRLMAATRNAQAEDLERLEDKCHDPTYACENYGICCGNNGYRQPGRKAPCAEAKPFTKIGDCAAIKTHAGDF